MLTVVPALTTNFVSKPASNNFRIDENLTAYVFKQPTTLDEEVQCRQGMEECPVAAIRGDGEVIAGQK